MGASLIVYLFIGLFVSFGVVQLCNTLRLNTLRVPAWLPVLLVAVIMLSFALVPLDTQAATEVFRSASN